MVARAFVVFAILVVGCIQAARAGTCTCTITPFGEIRSCQNSAVDCFRACKTFAPNSYAWDTFEEQYTFAPFSYGAGACTLAGEQCRIASGEVAVKLYEHSDFHGAERSFKVSAYSDLDQQTYCNSIVRIGGTVTSIRVPTGYTVELYKGYNFTEQCLKIVGSDIVHNLDITQKVFNDEPRSMKIYAQPVGKAPVGEQLSRCPTR